MRANLLLVSVDDFPVQLSQFLQDQGFSCQYSRGGIRTKEILKTQSIDAIMWLFLGHENALAQDLLKIFNQHENIPIIFVTQNYDELNFADDIKGLFANLDLNDDFEDFLKTVEIACNQRPADNDVERVDSPSFPEIDFKNIVSHIFDDRAAGNSQLDVTSLKNVTLWNAVDKNEKQILSAPLADRKKPILIKLKNWFRS